MQKHVNRVDLVKSVPTNIYLQNLGSIQKKTSPLKFAHLAEKLEQGSISKLSTKRCTPFSLRALRVDGGGRKRNRERQNDARADECRHRAHRDHQPNQLTLDGVERQDVNPELEREDEGRHHRSDGQRRRDHGVKR